MVRSGCLSLSEIARLREQGAVGDVLGNYVDAEGRSVASPHSNRLIGLSVDQLRRIETVVAVVSEAGKLQAINGVLRAGVVDVLIVDEGNARLLADLVGQEAGVEPVSLALRAASRRL
jgi:DNA-binding transcriptional regulator LsrR (DeoR family)